MKDTVYMHVDWAIDSLCRWVSRELSSTYGKQVIGMNRMRRQYADWGNGKLKKIL